MSSIPLAESRPLRLPAAPEANILKPASSLITSLVVGSVPALALAIAVAKGGSSNPWVYPLAAITFLVNTCIVLMDLRHGLALFIVAAGLSPKLPGLYNNLRVEDFVFVLVFGVWLARAVQSGRFPTVRSPIIAPFLVLTVLSFFSGIWGNAMGMIPDPKYSVFLQLKRIEYFLIFYVVATTVRSEAWLRILTILFVASGALAAVYGLVHASEDELIEGAGKRVTGPEGENYNTLSGYLVVCIGAGLAAIPGFRKGMPRTILLGSTIVAALGLLASFSREGYIMLMGSLIVFGFTKHRWILVLAAVALVAAFTVSEPVRARVQNTVDQIQRSQNDDPGSNSLTARYRAWEYRWNGWFLKQPLIGTGVGSVALSVDNEYLLRLCEVGLIGFGAFLWWLTAIGQQVFRMRKVPGLPQLLGLGLMAGFVGLLIQGLVGASFTTIRTMEPFWFLLGLLSAAVMIHRRTQEQAEADRLEAATQRVAAPA